MRVSVQVVLRRPVQDLQTEKSRNYLRGVVTSSATFYTHVICQVLHFDVIFYPFDIFRRDEIFIQNLFLCSFLMKSWNQ